MFFKTFLFLKLYGYRQHSPEAMMDKATETAKLFRRGCLQYLDDFGLEVKNKTH